MASERLFSLLSVAIIAVSLWAGISFSINSGIKEDHYIHPQIVDEMANYENDFYKQLRFLYNSGKGDEIIKLIEDYRTGEGDIMGMFNSDSSFDFDTTSLSVSREYETYEYRVERRNQDEYLDHYLIGAKMSHKPAIEQYLSDAYIELEFENGATITSELEFSTNSSSTESYFNYLYDRFYHQDDESFDQEFTKFRLVFPYVPHHMKDGEMIKKATLDTSLMVSESGFYPIYIRDCNAETHPGMICGSGSGSDNHPEYRLSDMCSATYMRGNEQVNLNFLRQSAEVDIEGKEIIENSEVEFAKEEFSRLSFRNFYVQDFSDSESLYLPHNSFGCENIDD